VAKPMGKFARSLDSAQDDTRRYPARCQLTFGTKTPTMASRFRDSSYAEILAVIDRRYSA
jgi:hypothetical protein